jgi:chromate transporter
MTDRSGSLPGPSVTFRQALGVWVRVAVQSFGGPAGQIAVMHRIIVDEKRWLSEERFLHALNYCMLLPGPEAQQLAIYVGWLLHGYRGGLAAGILFVLPGFLSILGLSVMYAVFQGVTVVTALFFGLQAAVLAVVIEAVLRIGRRVLKNGAMVGIAAAAFVGIFFLEIPFPLIIAGAALLGLSGHRIRPDLFEVIQGRRAAGNAGPGAAEAAAESALADINHHHGRPSVVRAAQILGAGLALWFLPVVVIAAVLGSGHVLVVEGVFFSKAAVVTFGGAYSVLAYVAQEAVERYGWLQPGEMLDGLGMAETTPGPLIQVVQFVGFLGAYRNPGPFDPLTAGLLGSILVTWVTFVPCFIWIFLGAPYIERLRGNRRPQRGEQRRHHDEVERRRAEQPAEDHLGHRAEDLVARMVAGEHQRDEREPGGQCGHDDRRHPLLGALDHRIRAASCPRVSSSCW